MEKKCTHVNMEPRSEERGATGSWTTQIRSTPAARSANWLQGWGSLPNGVLPNGVDRVMSRAEILRTGRWLNPKSWAPRNNGKIESNSSLETTYGYVDERLPLPGGGREGSHRRTAERRDKTVPWQVQRRLMQAMTNSFPCGAH